MKKVYLRKIPSSHVPACYYFLNRAGKTILNIRICEIDREKIMHNSESNTIIKEISPKLSPVLGKNENKIIAAWNPGSKVLGTTQNQKQLPLQGLANVRSFLSLGVLAVQIAMIVNNMWGLSGKSLIF